MRIRLFLIAVLILSMPGLAWGAESAGQAEGTNPFSGYFLDSLFTAVAFVILLFLLWRFAWQPMIRLLNEREQYIEKQLSDAKGTKEQANQILAQYEDKLANAEQSGKMIIDARIKEAEKQSRDILENTRQEMESMRLKLETDIERARRQAEAELLTRSGEIILKLGKEILGKTIEPEDNQKLIQNAVERLRQEYSQD